MVRIVQDAIVMVVDIRLSVLFVLLVVEVTRWMDGQAMVRIVQDAIVMLVDIRMFVLFVLLVVEWRGGWIRRRLAAVLCSAS